MKMQTLPLSGGAVTFEGAIDLAVTPEGIQPWRLPTNEIELFWPVLQGRAAAPAGVRLTLLSDTATLRITADSPASVSSQVADTMAMDLLVDGKFHQRLNVPSAEIATFEFTGLPEGEHRLEAYLDQKIPVRIRSVEVDAGASSRPWVDPRPRWVVYGSSITQCGAAAGPCETWPALVAQRYDLHLTCLGYGGNCHMEPMVARVIRDRHADYISLCLGINVMGGSSLGPRTFREAVIGLIKIIREKHPNTPMLVVSPICSPPREVTDNAVGLNLTKMREIIRDAVALLQRHGDANLVLQDGGEMFGPEFVELMPDKLHPNAEGYRQLAARYGDLAMPRLGLTAPAAACSH